MASRHKKSQRIIRIDSFGDQMTLAARAVLKAQDGLSPSCEHYQLLSTISDKIKEVTLQISGESELPWVAQMRGQLWPTK